MTRFPDAFNNLGRAYIEIEAFEDALVPLKTAIKLAPDLLAANVNIAEAYLGAKEFKASIEFYDKAVSIKPDLPEAISGLAMAHKEEGAYRSAIEYFQRAMELVADETNRDACAVSIVDCLQSLGENDDVMPFIENFLAENPHSPSVLGRKGQELGRSGRFDEASACYQQSTSLNPLESGIWIGLSLIRRWTADDPLLVQVQDLFDRGEFASEDAANIGFMLGKAMEDIKDHARVFPFLNPANARFRREFVYSTADVEADFESMQQKYSAEVYRDIAGAGSRDSTPIFILGLPRSGTTLMEQIISNHPDVVGGGEVGAFSGPLMRAITDKNGKFLCAMLSTQTSWNELSGIASIRFAIGLPILSM
ncbi:MAG: tetratricopeptide repeat protein [Alphaproteobacteria bacterium]|nr:tetratricopeptide repeat protein [Alphaproteobacteria bacterium]